MLIKIGYQMRVASDQANVVQYSILTTVYPTNRLSITLKVPACLLQSLTPVPQS